MKTLSSELLNSAINLFSLSELQDAYKASLYYAKKLADIDSGSLFLHQQNNFQRIYTSVPKEKQGSPSLYGLSYKAMKAGKPFVHTSTSLKKTHPELYKNGVRNIIILPLSFRSHAIGIVTLQSYRQRRFHRQTLEGLQFLATITTVSIQKTRQITDLQEILATRDLFISLASHELKNPITTISMYEQLIKKSIAAKNIPHEKWIDVLTNETNRLLQMLDDLLGKDRFSLGQIDYHWQTCSLEEIVEETIERYQTSHPQRKIKLDNNIGTDGLILGDRNKIQQVIVNILNNALKFSPPGKYIEVFTDKNKTGYYISITDYGKGIHKKEVKKLFEKYYKADPHAEGMGLGLYLAKNIVERHQGKIKIKSKIGGGTTVTITLPKLQYDR